MNDVILTEVLPAETVRQLADWFARGSTGKFIIHTKNGKPLIAEEAISDQHPIVFDKS